MEMSSTSIEKPAGTPPCPRSYRLQKRQEAVEENRTRVLQAARAVLLDRGFPAFTIEEIARQAGVSRQTVHNQFGSKTALLEALCDSAAVGGGLTNLAAAFQQRDAWAALSDFIAVFVRFWASDQGLTRRLHG